jgi:hypothetical protein
MRSTGAVVWMAAPACRAAVARRCVTTPIPPSTTIHVPPEPGSRHCSQQQQQRQQQCEVWRPRECVCVWGGDAASRPPATAPRGRASVWRVRCPSDNQRKFHRESMLPPSPCCAPGSSCQCQACPTCHSDHCGCVEQGTAEARCEACPNNRNSHEPCSTPAKRHPSPLHTPPESVSHRVHGRQQVTLEAKPANVSRQQATPWATRDHASTSVHPPPSPLLTHAHAHAHAHTESTQTQHTHLSRYCDTGCLQRSTKADRRAGRTKRSAVSSSDSGSSIQVGAMSSRSAAISDCEHSRVDAGLREGGRMDALSSAAQHSAAQHSTAQRSTAQRSAAQHSTACSPPPAGRSAPASPAVRRTEETAAASRPHRCQTAGIAGLQARTHASSGQGQQQQWWHGTGCLAVASGRHHFRSSHCSELLPAHKPVVGRK